MKKGIITVTLLVLSILTQAQLWKKHYQTQGSAEHYSFEEIRGGYAILTSGNYDLSSGLYKVNLSGDYLWHVNLHGNNSVMTASGDGGLIYAGAFNISSPPSDSSWIVIAKITSDASEEWKIYSKDAPGEIINPIGIVQTSDGSIYIAVKLTASNYVIKLDSTGNIIWKVPFSQYTIYNVAPYNNSEVLFVGRQAGNIMMVRLDAQGAIVRSQSLGISTSVYNNKLNVSQTTDGGHIINAQFNTTPLIIKTDNQSNIMWTDTFSAHSVAENSDGSFYITYNVRDTAFLPTDTIQYLQIGLKKMTSSGANVWSKAFPLSFLYETERDGIAKFTSDGSLLILGEHFITYGLLLMKTDTLGTDPQTGTLQSLFNSEVLSINNIAARFTPEGSSFWDFNEAGFEVPRDSGTHTIFAAGLWMGGIDAGGQLKLAAQTYRQSGTDYWPGIINNTTGNVDLQATAQWEKIWKITRAQVEQHIADFNDNGIIDNPIDAIFDWPAKGNPYARGNGGVPLVINQEAAPFFDFDLNGFYNPNSGDYPDIKGDEMLWYVFNDKAGLHSETGALPLGVEIQVSAYGYNCPADDILYNTLFINYKIIHKGTLPIQDVYIGKWVDFDLGCFNNDYIGCDTISNSFYAYNGYSTDPDCANPGFGNDPPIQTVTFLDKHMSGFTYYNNDFSVTGNPENAVHYYNYLAGFWKDNSPITYDSSGYGGTSPTRFMFPGNPSDTTQWSECSVNRFPADRRGIGSIGPFNLIQGQIIHMTLAYSTHFLPFSGCPDFTPYRERIDSIQFKFDNDLLQSCTQSSFSCSDTALGCVWPGDANADGVADVYDVLPLGIAFDTSGPVRPNATTLWTGQPMQDWPQNFTSIGQNYKHADCDGSGLVDSADFQPILDNYGLVHLKNEQSSKVGIPLYLDFPQGFHPAGSTVSVPVMLGTSGLQVSDFYGIAFRVAYNTAVVQPGSVTVDFSNNWIGTPGQDLIGIYKELFPNGRIDVGITRIDHATRAGYGMITTINYILIDDIAGKGGPVQLLAPVMVEAYAISNDESEIELDIISAVDETNPAMQIRVYPIPVDEQLVIEYPSSESWMMQLFDVAGKMLYENTSPASPRVLIDTKTFGNGIYFLRLKAGNNLHTQKVIINR